MFLLAAVSLPMIGQSKFVTVSDGHFLKDGQPYYYVGTNFWYGAILGSEGQGGNRGNINIFHLSHDAGYLPQSPKPLASLTGSPERTTRNPQPFVGASHLPPLLCKHFLLISYYMIFSQSLDRAAQHSADGKAFCVGSLCQLVAEIPRDAAYT